MIFPKSGSLGWLGGQCVIHSTDFISLSCVIWILTGALAFFQWLKVVQIAKAPTVLETFTLFGLIVVKIPGNITPTDTRIFFQKAEIWLSFLQCQFCSHLWMISYTVFFAFFQTDKSILIPFTSSIYKFFTLVSENIEKVSLYECSAGAIINLHCTKCLHWLQWWQFHICSICKFFIFLNCWVNTGRDNSK